MIPISQHRKEHVRAGKVCLVWLGGLPVPIRVSSRTEDNGEVKYRGIVGEKVVSFGPENVLEVED